MSNWQPEMQVKLARIEALDQSLYRLTPLSRPEELLPSDEGDIPDQEQQQVIPSELSIVQILQLGYRQIQ
jgi:hypothetical protein